MDNYDAEVMIDWSHYEDQSDMIEEMLERNT